MHLVCLQINTTDDFEVNFEKLSNIIQDSPKHSIILASELILTGYAYNDFEFANVITARAIEKLLELSLNKTIIITMIYTENNQTYNKLFVFDNCKIVHTQSKSELFVLNDEKVYFTSGSYDDIHIFEINGIKFGALICFELRFTAFWEKLKGADIILVPAMWGINRKDHYETLTKALAIANQCFVMASDSANDDMAKASGIITPFGVETRDDTKEVIEADIDFDEIKKMRRYMNVRIC